MNTNPITLDDLKAYNEALYTRGNITREQQTLLDRLAPVNKLATTIAMLEQQQATITAQSRLLALAETLANTAGGHLSYGDDARFTKLTLDALCDALVAYEAARTEYQTTGTVPCRECEAKDERIGQLEGVLNERNLLWAERDDLRRQLAEAKLQNEAFVGKVYEAYADNAALLAVLESTLDNYAPMGGNGRTCEECDGFDSHIEGCRMFHVAEALSQSHPGAPMREEMAALRVVERFLRHAMDLNVIVASPESALTQSLATLDAIRNRKEPANG